MKYIQNNGRYAIAFAVNKNGREVKISFDKKRIYMDTGNIATSGITEIDEADLKQLQELRSFNKLFETKDFTFVDGFAVNDVVDKVALKAKDEEIKKLKMALKDKTPEKRVVEAKDKEIATLKAQLEALKTKKDESTGF